MKPDFNDDLTPNTITKKFQSSFRSVSKASKMPKKKFLDGVIKNDPEDMANIFNQHFLTQFSEESSYEIDINNDSFLDFTFKEVFIFNLK